LEKAAQLVKKYLVEAITTKIPVDADELLITAVIEPSKYR